MHTRADGPAHVAASAELELRRTRAQLKATTRTARGVDRRGDLGSLGCHRHRYRGLPRLPRRPMT